MFCAVIQLHILDIYTVQFRDELVKLSQKRMEMFAYLLENIAWVWLVMYTNKRK